MNKIQMLVVIAGAALGFGASAFAQTASNDSNRAYGAELVSDAGNRTSLLAADTGYNKDGFMIGSADGASSLYVIGSAQIRYYMDFRSEPDGGSTGSGPNDVESFTHGFENRLTRIGVKGSVWSKDFTYQVRGQFTNTGVFGLETGFAAYKWDNGVGVMAGQFKSPLFRESMIDNEYQLAAERSVTSGLFGDSYSQGIQFTYASDAWRMWAGFTDGLNTANTPFNTATMRAGFTDSGEADYAFNARGEFKVMGNNWERFDDFTSWKNAEDTGILIGAAIWYQASGSTGGTSGIDSNGDPVVGLKNLLYTIDAQFEGQGWNAFVAGLATHQDTDADNSESTDDFGLVAQGGIFVSDQVELFARYDAVFFDKNHRDANDDKIKDQHFISAGVNYYLSPESHAAKLTAELIWALQKTDEVFGAGTPASGSTDAVPGGFLGGTTQYGLLGQADKDEIGIILQLQAVY